MPWGKMSKKSILEVKDLSFSYGNKPILSNANLNIQQSDFIAVVGPNGSGKSTLLKIMLGLLKPNRGSITLMGQDPASFNQWDRIGYIPQRAAAFDPTFPATVKEVLEAHQSAHLGLFKFLKTQHKERVREVLELVGLSHCADSMVGKLSGGQQQRVFLARTLVTRPDLIFMDEPMAGIDTESQSSLYTLLSGLHENHRLTLIMVTHDIISAAQRVNRMVCIYNQEIIEHNPKEYMKKQLFKERDGFLSQFYHLHLAEGE